MTKILKLYALFAFLMVFSIVGKAQVSTSGRNLLVNGQRYIIRGVTYNPVPIGSSTRSWATLSQDLVLMKEANINTVRVYSPIDDQGVLDAFSNAGIKLIIGFGFNNNGYFDILSGSFINYVNKYKTHPAILLWEMGNEYNYHPEWFSNNVANWYTALNNAAAKVHQNDAGHPAATAHGELPNDQARNACPNIDIWGMNVYRGDNPSTIFPQWAAVSGKPMYISETGADSYMTIAQNGYAAGPNQGMQANAVNTILINTFNSTAVNSGVCLFSFVDEWWKAGNNSTQDPGGWAPNSSSTPYDGTANEEYWGITDIYRNRKNAFYVVRDQYAKLVVNPVANPVALPGRIVAVNYTAMSGVQSEPTSDVGGGSDLGYINNNSYSDYLVNVTNTGAYTFQCRVASASSGGTIQVRNGATVLGSITVPGTGGWQTWTTVSGSVNLTAGTQTIRLLYLGTSTGLFNLNWIDVKSQIPASTFISLKAKANGLFVSVGTDKLLRPASATVTSNEQFTLINNVDGTVSLKSNSSNAAGLYVSADQNRANTELIANRTSIGGWESLKRINNTDGTVSFMASNGFYVVAENGGSATLLANRTTIGDWEKFYMGSVSSTSAPASVVTGISTNGSETTILLYPNPVASSLTISTEGVYTKTIVIDYTGRVLIENTLNGEKQFSLDLAHLPSGAYILQLHAQEGMTSRKFFKL